MNLPNFDSESIEIDWLSFNVVGLHDPVTIVSNLSKYFKPYKTKIDIQHRGYSSAVERNLAKVDVARSNRVTHCPYRLEA